MSSSKFPKQVAELKTLFPSLDIDIVEYYLTINKKAQKEHFSPERDFNHPNDKWTYYDPHTNQFRLLNIPH